jgi:SAM-dependent methyltransferase
MSPTIYADEPSQELADVEAGRLPERYRLRMQDTLLSQLGPLLSEGVRVLDVGSGRSPTIDPADRPAGCHYVGLDLSARELAAAPAGAYDASLVHDISEPLAAQQPFDLIISWQVLEHVPNLERALENLGGLLRPGGTLLAQLSGSFAAFSLAARLLPHRLRVLAMARLLGHPEELKFPTRYDRCYDAALRRMLADWSEVEIVAFYRGAPYFAMSRPLQRTYLVYENALARQDRRNLATHYLIRATR